MSECRRFLGALALTLVLSVLIGGTANAGVVWCVKDPIFNVDGREVRVQDLVPIEYATTPIQFVLRVSPEARVSWHVPAGEVLLGSVRIVRDDEMDGDRAELSVRADGERFPMRLRLSGSGLRSTPREIAGSSAGMRVTLRLVGEEGR